MNTDFDICVFDIGSDFDCWRISPEIDFETGSELVRFVGVAHNPSDKSHNNDRT